MERLRALADAYGLPPGAGSRLLRLLELVEREPASITTIRDPATAVDVHVADSLVGVPVVRGAPDLADIGSGAGFPGLVLAVALPETAVTLVESVARKARFLQRAVADLGLANVTVANGRIEDLLPERFHVVTARALAELPVLVEYAAPVLAPGGLLVAWKGRRAPDEVADGEAAAAALGMSPPAWRPVDPYPGVERHLVASRKLEPTPPGYPRRPGMARKRPLRAARRGA